MPLPRLCPSRALQAVAGLVVWLLVTGMASAQIPPAPADGILDETRALTEAAHRQIAEDIRLFRDNLKCDVWLTATSFLPTGTTVRRHAQITRQGWSGDRPAVLMAYDRATNSSGMSFSSSFWQHYPSAELFELMQEARRILNDETLTLDERLVQSTRSWMERLRVLESVRLKQSLLIQRDEKKLALVSASTLGGLALLAALLGLVSRRSGARAEHRFHFPDLQVGTRFGAPYGGGVVVEVKPGSAGTQ